MPGNTQATLYISNMDERVDERLLYEIMVQAGPLVDVYIPRDKETKRHKGYGFAEYTTEESATYALSLFSGLVSLYKRSLRLAISGADKASIPAGDKTPQVLDNPNNSINNSLRDSPKTFIQHHHSNHYDSPKAFIQQQPFPAFNHPQGPVYGTRNGGLAMPETVLNTMAFAQNYNFQMSMLGQHALQMQTYPRHPHSHVSYEV